MKYIKPEMEEVLLNLRDGIMTVNSIVIKNDGEEIEDGNKILAPERRRGSADVWEEW